MGGLKKDGGSDTPHHRIINFLYNFLSKDIYRISLDIYPLTFWISYDIIGYMAKILLTIPDDMLKDLDERCGKLHYDRSEFVRGVLRDKLYFVPSVGVRGDLLEKSGNSITAEVADESSNMSEETMDKLKDAVDDSTYVATVGNVDNPTRSVEAFLPEYTPGFCTKCYKKTEVKTVEYQDADGNEFKETLCKTHVKKLETFLKK